jgi:hypothetical protein
MGDNFFYNSIYIIESLDNTEIKTGSKLYELIKNFEFKFSGVKTYLKSPKTKSELFEVLSSIKDLVQNYNHLPIIHLEIHGNHKGVQCSNSDFIFWEELYPYFIDINIKLKNTLIITSSICFGAHLYFSVDINKPAPFFTIISSFSEINNETILESYEGFYNEFLKSESMVNAISLLNPQYLKPTDNEFLLEAYISIMFDEFLKQISETPALDNFLITQSDSKITLDAREKQIEESYNFRNKNFIKVIYAIWNSFLMIDLFPETKNRYKEIKDVLIEKIQTTDFNDRIRKDLINEVQIHD